MVARAAFSLREHSLTLCCQALPILQPSTYRKLVTTLITGPHIPTAVAAAPCAQRRGILQRLARPQLRQGSDPAPCSHSMGTAAPAAASTAPEPLPLEPPIYLTKIKSSYCRMCGGTVELVVPAGEKQFRHTCAQCSHIEYINPKMVVGCLVEHEGKILLCKRAIEPCYGLWTLPAGYMELQESSAAGAVRETMEEANAAVEIIAPYAHWDIPAIGQAYIMFRAKLVPPFTYSSGPESLDVQLFEPHELPMDQIAFSSVAVTLRLFLEDLAAGGKFRVHHGVIDKRPGASPNDPSTFEVRDHMAFTLAA